MTDGLQEYDNIRMIRIKSKSHTLLIMEDFMPVIGEIDGMVEIVFGEKAVAINNIRGFYMHKKNEFNLLIRDGNAKIANVEKQEEADAAGNH